LTGYGLGDAQREHALVPPAEVRLKGCFHLMAARIDANAATTSRLSIERCMAVPDSMEDRVSGGLAVEIGIK